MMSFTALSLFSLVLAISNCAALITPQQKIEILNVFNQARRTTVLPASDMKMLVWDENIALQAQAHTDRCIKTWARFTGATMAYYDEMPDPVAVAKWRTLRMAPYYDYTTGGCINSAASNATCRHPDNYEALVMAQTERVGCGMTYCWPELGRKAWFHSCGINGPNPRPARAWTLGARCSQCPVGWNFCVDGLCSKTPATPKPSASPTTSRAPTPPTTRRRRRRGLLEEEDV